MNPAHLESDEILYELLIRSIDRADTDEKQQRALRIALRDECKDKRSITFHNISGLNPKDEIDICTKKISEFSEVCLTWITKRDMKNLEILKSRLLHILSRLQRLMGLRDPPDETLPRITDIEKMIAQVNLYVKKSKSSSCTEPEHGDDSESSESDPTQRTFLGKGAVPKQTPFKPKHHSSRESRKSKDKSVNELEKAYEKIRLLTERLQLSEQQDVNVCDPTPNPILENSSSSSEEEVPERRHRKHFNRSHRVSKWNLTFNGVRKHHQLASFLTKVQHLRTAEGISSQELRKSSYYLFSGEALDWFIAFGDSFPTWRLLVQGLKAEFLPPDNSYWLLKEIESKLQKSDESFGAYLSKMEILFMNLPNPIEEGEKLTILKRNILPHFAEKISFLRIETVARLSYYCKQIETTMAQIASRKSASYKIDEVKPAVEIPQKVLYNPGVVKKRYDDRTVHLRCYNCFHEGHHFNQCTLPRKVFCYLCGSQGVTLPNCKRCSRPGNN